MKMKNIAGKVLCCLGLLVMLGACADVTNPPGEKISGGMGRVSLSIAGSGERTILPEMPLFSKYKFVFEALDGQEGRAPLFVNADGPVDETVELAPGNWAIYAVGYISISGIEGIDDGEYPAAEGMADVLVIAEETVSISIDITGGIRPGEQGFLSWEISLPADALSASMVLCTLDGEEVAAVDLMDMPHGDMALESAYYLLVLSLDSQRPRAEALHIYGGMTSRVNRSLFKLPAFDSTDNLAEWLDGLLPNTADTPYGIILHGLNLETDFHEGGDPLYKLYEALQGKFVEIDLSGCEGQAIPDTDYSAAAERPGKDSIVSVVLPQGITSVGDYAFYGCSNLSLVVYRATEPPVLGAGAFSGTHAGLAKEVPAGSIDAYKTASGWGAYSGRVWAIGSVRHTVSFDINDAGGTAPDAQTVNAGSGITLPGGNGFSKDGYVFGGWNTSPDGNGTAYEAGASYTPEGNITLYAKWFLEAAFVITLSEVNEWYLVEHTVQIAANADREFNVGNTSYVSYQWYLDGVLVGTEASYTFNEDTEVYELVVVVSSAAGETRSGRCRVTVAE